MLWTAATALLSVVCVLVENQLPGSLASRVLVAVLAPLVLAANMAGIALLLLREWANVHIRWFPFRVYRARRRLTWRMLHIIDHYLALGAAWALVLFVLWVWDDSAERSRYFEFDYAASRRNAWAGWLRMLGIVFYNFASVSIPVIHHPASEALIVALTLVADLSKLLLFALVAGEGYALAKEAMQRSKHDGEANTPGRPEQSGDVPEGRIALKEFDFPMSL